MILAAGFGTRLRPLTDELPKPLVPVGDRPLLAHAVARLAAQGCDEIVVNTHHRADKFSFALRDLPAKLKVSHEVEILGTAGGIAAARPLLGAPPAVVVNGDILCRVPVADLLGAADDGLTLLVAPRPAGSGTVGLGAAGEVVRLRGRLFGDEVAGADYVGAAVLGARCLATLPPRGCLVGDWALPELAAGRRIGTVRLEGSWLDVGSPEGYLAANLAWLEERAAERRGWFAAGEVAGELDAAAGFVGAGASVSARVMLERCVVGAGAQVSGAGALTRCVVWPGARVQAPLSDAIVTAQGRVLSCAPS
jgi:mannose-1-phosphate guanylyltransferase